MGAGLELFGLCKDGSEDPVEISLSPIASEERQLVICAVRDVRECQKADRQFRALLESAPDAMVIVDVEGRIVLVNGQTERMFGWERRELLGQPIQVLIPERLRDSHPGHRSAFFSAPRARHGAGARAVRRAARRHRVSGRDQSTSSFAESFHVTTDNAALPAALLW